MAAGIPGTGINGIFYTLLVLVAPLREIPRTLAGESSRARWKHIGRLFVMMSAVVAVLALEYWLLVRAADYASLHWSRFGNWGLAFESVAPRLAMTPFIILACVLGGIQFLRLAMWLRGPLRVRARTAALILLLATSAAAAACATVMRGPSDLHLSSGYDFRGVTGVEPAHYRDNHTNVPAYGVHESP